MTWVLLDPEQLVDGARALETTADEIGQVGRTLVAALNGGGLPLALVDELLLAVGAARSAISGTCAWLCEASVDLRYRADMIASDSSLAGVLTTLSDPVETTTSAPAISSIGEAASGPGTASPVSGDATTIALLGGGWTAVGDLYVGPAPTYPTPATAMAIIGGGPAESVTVGATPMSTTPTTSVAFVGGDSYGSHVMVGSSPVSGTFTTGIATIGGPGYADISTPPPAGTPALDRLLSSIQRGVGAGPAGTPNLVGALGSYFTSQSDQAGLLAGTSYSTAVGNGYIGSRAQFASDTGLSGHGNSGTGGW